MDGATTVLLCSAIAQFVVGGVTVLAIYMAPITALKLQQAKEEKLNLEQTKRGIFRTLMTHRATPLAVPFVQALNSIDLEFRSSDQFDEKIRLAWTELLAHWSSPDAQKSPDYKSKQDDFISALLTEMGSALGYNFDGDYIKRHSYYPSAHGFLEAEQQELRRLELNLLRGNSKLGVAIFEEKFPDLQPPPKE